MAYNKRTKFIYKTYKDCSGYSIKRLDWKKFMYQPENKTIAKLLRSQIKRDYEIFIMNKVRLEKARALEKWNQRADYDAVMQVVDNNNFDLNVKSPYNSDSSDDVGNEDTDSAQLVNQIISKL